MDNMYAKSYVINQDNGDFKKPPVPPKPKSGDKYGVSSYQI
jgi:hypothetical protein